MGSVEYKKIEYKKKPGPTDRRFPCRYRHSAVPLFTGRRWSFPLTAAGQFRIHTGFPFVHRLMQHNASREAYQYTFLVLYMVSLCQSSTKWSVGAKFS